LVDITGSGFLGTTNVTFGGGRSAKPGVLFATVMDATVPNGALTGPISVTNASGSATSAANYTVLLSVTGFTPASGPAGTFVTIKGVGFNSGSTVKFDSTPATSVIFVSYYRLLAAVPSGAVTGPISVTNTSGTVGTVTSPGKFTVT
jgi:hypothetical protein